MTGLSWKTSLTVVAIIVTAILVMGGMWSVAITDFVQVGLIVFGMLIAIPFSLNYAGGWSNVVNNVPPETWNLFS